MAEFIKVSAVIGIFTMYVVVTIVPGIIVHHFIKHTTIDEPLDLRAIAKSLLVPYVLGLIVFMWVVTYFMFVRG